MFNSELATGVDYASFGGGTHIFIKGDAFHEDPQSNMILLESAELGQTVTAPLLSQDDAFNSNPMIGKIAYRLPSMVELFGLPQETFDQYYSMTFTLKVQYSDATVGGAVTLECGNSNNCKIIYKKNYSPVLYYLSPPVVYEGAVVDFWFNPKNIMSLLKDLPTDDLPFINMKIGDALVDFEGYVDSTTTFSSQNRNRVRGRVTDQPLGDQNATMMWETGKSMEQSQEM